MADEKFDLSEYGIQQAGNVEVQDALANHVKRCFDDAAQHRRNIGIDGILLRNLRANKCEYQPDEIALLGPFNDVYMGISALKARAAESWLTDIILNNIEKPWTLDPTPEPDLAEDKKEEVVDILINELPGLNSVEALRDRAKQLKSAQTEIAFSEAERATKRMESRISDQLAEGDWTQEFIKFLGDLVAYPTALMRGPVVIGKTVGAWDKNKFGPKKVSLPTVRTISPFDAFPAPNAISANEGQFFCERIKYSQATLYGLIGVDGFNGGNIRQVIDRYPDGYCREVMYDAERQRLEDKDSGVVSILGSTSRDFETIIYNGKVKGELLADHGVIVKDKQASYECEIWLVGDYVIRAILNPNPTGTRPIYNTSYRKVRGSFWGQGVICLTYDVNRMCNAAARSLVRNMGYSSGPIGEVVSERVSETQDPTAIQPYIIKLVGPDDTGTGSPAYRFHNIQSVAPDLINVFNQYMKYADDLSGVPSYVLGNPQVAGAGRTLGGLSMLMGNAAKGIKNVQLNIDRDIISGIIAGFYAYNMLTSKDDSIKADAKVVARGATGLLQRELAQTRTVELLQLFTPYIERWDDLPDGIKMMLREVLKTTGLPVDKIIPDPEEGAKINEIVSLFGGTMPRIPPVGLERGTSTPPALPPQSRPTAQLPAIPAPVGMATGA